MTKRIQQVDLLIKEELSKMIVREIEFPPGVLVTVTRVETTPNLIEARVFVSVLPESKTKDILQLLKGRIYDLQQGINKKLIMRPIPKIIFIGEGKTREAARIEEILEQLKNDKNQDNI